MSTKQIHPDVRECQQSDRAFNRKWKHRNNRRHRNWWKAWWKAWYKRYKAEQLKEKECRKSKTIVFRKDDADEEKTKD